MPHYLRILGDRLFSWNSEGKVMIKSRLSMLTLKEWYKFESILAAVFVFVTSFPELRSVLGYIYLIWILIIFLKTGAKIA